MSQPADALYLILLLILPVAALASRRLPVGQTVKMALIWVAIFGALFFLVAAWQVATGAGGMIGSVFHG